VLAELPSELQSDNPDSNRHQQQPYPEEEKKIPLQPSRQSSNFFANDHYYTEYDDYGRDYIASNIPLRRDDGIQLSQIGNDVRLSRPTALFLGNNKVSPVVTISGFGSNDFTNTNNVRYNGESFGQQSYYNDSHHQN